MESFLNYFKPYFTFILFFIPVVAMLLIPVFQKLIDKAGAAAGLVFGIFYVFLLPIGDSSSNAMVVIFPAAFILGAFLVSYLQRQYLNFGSFWYSLLAFVLIYVILFVVGYLTR